MSLPEGVETALRPFEDGRLKRMSIEDVVRVVVELRSEFTKLVQERHDTAVLLEKSQEAYGQVKEENERLKSKLRAKTSDEKDAEIAYLEQQRDHYVQRFNEAEEERDALKADLDRVRGVVDEQAEDEALWALNLDGTLPASEAYLQQELRRLHEAVECAAKTEEGEADG